MFDHIQKTIFYWIKKNNNLFKHTIHIKSLRILQQIIILFFKKKKKTRYNIPNTINAKKYSSRCNLYNKIVPWRHYGNRYNANNKI